MFVKKLLLCKQIEGNISSAIHGSWSAPERLQGNRCSKQGVAGLAREIPNHHRGHASVHRKRMERLDT